MNFPLCHTKIFFFGYMYLKYAILNLKKMRFYFIMWKGIFHIFFDGEYLNSALSFEEKESQALWAA